MSTFCSPAKLARCASGEEWAVPALNANGADYDIARAFLEVAEQTRSPLILGAYDDNIQYRGYDYFAELARFLCRGATVPVALMLDHGRGMESIMRAVRAGFTGVMVDSAGLSTEQNLERINLVAGLVHPLGVAVEAEVGHVAGGQGTGDVPRSDPLEVKEFAERTEADMLAVSVGTAHGIFEVQDYLDTELLERIDRATDLPLVLHGTSGLRDELVSRAAAGGMDKVNFGEIFRLNYIDYHARFTEELDHEGHTWRIARACKEELKKDVRRVFEALGCAGKATLVARQI